MLSTCENHTCTIIQGKNNKLKPDTVFFYNDAKKGVDLSDQMSSYYNCLRKTLKWYRKIIIQLICGTCLVNAWYIHKKWGIKHINTLKFKEHIIDHLLVNNYRSEEIAIGKQIPSKRDSHFLHSYEGPTRKTRQRFKECYKCYKCLYKKKVESMLRSKLKK